MAIAGIVHVELVAAAVSNRLSCLLLLGNQHLAAPLSHDGGAVFFTYSI